jgi:hypothetical protein
MAPRGFPEHEFQENGHIGEAGAVKGRPDGMPRADVTGS